MSAVVTAIVASVVVSAYSAYSSSKRQSKATKRAAEIYAESVGRALTLEEEMYFKGLELQQPFYDVGLAALPELQKAIMGGYEYKPSPVAEYAMETGGREYMRGLGARGLAGGGLAPYKLAELTPSIYASDYDKQIARLSGLVDIGRGTASNLSTLGQQYGQSAANININAGENAANAILAQGRNQASLYQGLGQIPMNLTSAYLMGGGTFGGGNYTNTTMNTTLSSR